MALEQMAQALQQGQDFPYAIQVGVVDHAMINAFALPGGHIIVMRGLIDMAETSDQLAAVLAHELGMWRKEIPLNKHCARQAGRAYYLWCSGMRQAGPHWPLPGRR
jgi:predicted Zn-dependent protease